MTQTLTTERLKQIASGDAFICTQDDESVAMARELLANREAQPVGYTENGKGFIYQPEHRDRIQNPVAVFTAPPAPAVPEALANDIDSDDHPLLWSHNNGWNACRAAMLAQPVSPGKLPPHAYRELVNSLRDTAVKYSGTDQLRERLNTALSQFIEPDHPHTRTAAPEGGNDA